MSDDDDHKAMVAEIRRAEELCRRAIKRAAKAHPDDYEATVMSITTALVCNAVIMMRDTRGMEIDDTLVKLAHVVIDMVSLEDRFKASH